MREHDGRVRLVHFDPADILELANGIGGLVRPDGLSNALEEDIVQWVPA